LIGEGLHLTDRGAGDIALANVLAGREKYSSAKRGNKEAASNYLHNEIDKKCNGKGK